MAVGGGAVAATSVILAKQARERDIEHCKAYIEGFEGKGATVQEMQEYGQCVELIYPLEEPDPAVVLFIVLVTIALVLWVVFRE